MLQFAGVVWNVNKRRRGGFNMLSITFRSLSHYVASPAVRAICDSAVFATLLLFLLSVAFKRPQGAESTCSS